MRIRVFIVTLFAPGLGDVGVGPDSEFAVNKRGGNFSANHGWQRKPYQLPDTV